MAEVASISRPERASRGVADQRAHRLSSIDMLRGAAVVIMALDHVRDSFMVAAQSDPMNDPNISPLLFSTRWITHFCAPVFVMLAGVSAGLMTRRKTTAELGRFLLMRGLWLIFVEFFIISTAWTFAPAGIADFGGSTIVTMQVIWAIGASMVVLSGLQWLGRKTCLVIGFVILAAHNGLDAFWPKSELLQHGPLWVALHGQVSHPLGPFLLVFIYPVLPWIGVMLCGFGAASVFEMDARRRDTLLLKGGLGMTVLFVLLRTVDWYGDPNPWQRQQMLVGSLIDFLNTTKYPPSLLFLLMTLGPAAVLCSVADRCRGVVKDVLVTFGRVPFAFYVSHLYLIHVLSLLLGLAQGFEARDFTTIFFLFPKTYGVGLPGVYVGWALVVLLLFPFCRWMASVKGRRRDWWLSYL